MRYVVSAQVLEATITFVENNFFDEYENIFLPCDKYWIVEQPEHRYICDYKYTANRLLFNILVIESLIEPVLYNTGDLHLTGDTRFRLTEKGEQIFGILLL